MAREQEDRILNSIRQAPETFNKLIMLYGLEGGGRP